MNTQELIDGLKQMAGAAFARGNAAEVDCLLDAAQALTASQEREEILKGVLADIAVTGAPWDYSNHEYLRSLARQALQSTEQQG